MILAYVFEINEKNEVIYDRCSFLIYNISTIAEIRNVYRMSILVLTTRGKVEYVLAIFELFIGI